MHVFSCTISSIFVKQRERKRRNSDRSEDGYHSDGDYPEQDYRREPGEEKKSKTVMLWGLSPHITEDDVSVNFSSAVMQFLLVWFYVCAALILCNEMVLNLNV